MDKPFDEKNNEKPAESSNVGTQATVADQTKASDKIRIADKSSLHSAREQMIGQILDGKYEILRVVGVGGMSIVYQARHLLMNKVVALKLMHKHLVMEDEVVRRFQKEAKAVTDLYHNGIIRIYDFGISGEGDPYIAMELLQGQSLGDRVEEKGPLDSDTAIAVFKSVAESLAYAHKQRLVHRDLKPNNIVLLDSHPGMPPKTKVVDFGIAKIASDDSEDQSNVNASGEVFGSPLYMSPEQCAGRELDQRSDIYSFGCLMYESVTGSAPFHAPTVVLLVKKHFEEEAARFSTLVPRPNIYVGLEDVILKCLEKHPEDRFQSMDEIVAALTEVQAQNVVKLPDWLNSPNRPNANNQTAPQNESGQNSGSGNGKTNSGDSALADSLNSSGQQLSENGNSTLKTAEQLSEDVVPASENDPKSKGLLQNFLALLRKKK